MNIISYHLKSIEYLLRKFRVCITSDLAFHTAKLKKISGDSPDIINPSTLNEKICHRLVFDHNPLYTMLADKLAVREYIFKKTKLAKTVPLIGVYNRIDDIDFCKLPDKFVLKCNHDSGSSIICTDRENFDYFKALNKLKILLKKNMYYTTREWQYKNIPPSIICEMYIDLFYDRKTKLIPEMLRIHCFHGVACFIEADFTDEEGREFINVYDKSWDLQPFMMEYENTPEPVHEPELFQNALIAAQEIASEIDYCRVDLMLKENDIYFSEITLSPKRGKLQITPDIWNAKLGELWDLRY